uniref:Uncharacterized protein n=1 Tax=Anopheles albimanus TaxID=7167 RepID=A0A182FU26_ANOAL
MLPCGWKVSAGRRSPHELIRNSSIATTAVIEVEGAGAGPSREMRHVGNIQVLFAPQIPIGRSIKPLGAEGENIQSQQQKQQQQQQQQHQHGALDRDSRESELTMDFKASTTATIATIDKGSDRTFASAFFHPPASPTHVGCCMLNRAPVRPPSEIYFESRGKCCKKLLRYNGYPNKVPGVLLYPEEGWARSAASSYWTIAPCRWRRNRCIVEEVAGSRK